MSALANAPNPIAVKVIIAADGRPHFYTVYPPHEPHPGLSWGQHVRSQGLSLNTESEDDCGGFYRYATTREDQEG